ncbi:phosphoribosyl-aminoimidazole-succinocarboxamide synthase [Coccidioides immitis RS]|uniref:Phosphoribosyl-aminoimidazole-succinocarboxamide synthase n=2 Tax=Coccidioides TaxID=5500 RepID=J3KF45_COCIM|nr:phosphoribosyl-aminoimidazole-succinocarboxamide synthase [Coccidioides immitis RS]EAS34202.3 phosphoribosyl-aminoimidazole-succinocarboxamide synthase [Coccidioides immitis RS]KMM70703.1 HD domain-containing protein [Coccidioides posadasii RMSCC 3488]
MASLFTAGFFQTFTFPAPEQIFIHDALYGGHLITEPILVELLQSPSLLRLHGVSQHGVTGLFGLTPRVTRLEHSVGAFLLVRKVGASVEEQVSALLHDVSHTVLSHVVDWAFSTPGQESFHEVHKKRYIKTTELPEILTKHGFGNLKPLDEELYPLVEKPAPRLCADRLDYALRDAAAFGKMDIADVLRVFASLKAVPNATDPARQLVLEDSQLALSFARAYVACDRDVWANAAHIDMDQRTGLLIGDVIQRGAVKEESLWNLSDKDFWELLRGIANPDELEMMKRLESEGIPKKADSGLPRGAKIRTLDPDIYLPDTKQIFPLSTVRPEWATEVQEYIQSRRSQQD